MICVAFQKTLTHFADSAKGVEGVPALSAFL